MLMLLLLQVMVWTLMMLMLVVVVMVLMMEAGRTQDLLRSKHVQIDRRGLQVALLVLMTRVLLLLDAGLFDHGRPRQPLPPSIDVLLMRAAATATLVAATATTAIGIALVLTATGPAEFLKVPVPLTD